MVYLLSVKNVITFAKLIRLLLSSFPLLVLNVLTNNTRNEVARLVMGTFFLVESKYSKQSEQTVVLPLTFLSIY